MKREEFNALPFKEEYFHFHGWLPREQDKGQMGEESYLDAVKEYDEGDAKVLFANTLIEYDSDDSEYGTGKHFATEMQITDDNKAGIVFENKSISIEKNGYGTIFFEDLKKVSMGQFFTACQWIGIELKFKPEVQDQFDFEMWLEKVKLIAERTMPRDYKRGDKWLESFWKEKYFDSKYSPEETWNDYTTMVK